MKNEIKTNEEETKIITNELAETMRIGLEIWSEQSKIVSNLFKELWKPKNKELKQS